VISSSRALRAAFSVSTLSLAHARVVATRALLLTTGVLYEAI
jgi:hypothetical protein